MESEYLYDEQSRIWREFWKPIPNYIHPSNEEFIKRKMAKGGLNCSITLFIYAASMAEARRTL